MERKPISEIKVYRINDCDWYAGPSLDECIAEAMADSGLREDDVTQDPAELTDEQMDSLMFRDEDGAVLLTFRQMLAKLIREGEEFPCLFASTEY